MKQLTIISGGQTGVDRAALDFALSSKIPCSGWCPKGRMAEDGPIPFYYPLKELSSPFYAKRTRQNIIDSDGTLVLYRRKLDKGTKLAIELCQSLNKPVSIIPLDEQTSVGQAKSWIIENNIRVMNVAGPRESSEPGIYHASGKFLKELFHRLLGTSNLLNH